MNVEIFPSKTKIVLVDDDSALLSIFNESEFLANYEILGFQDGHEALRQLTDVSPDLIILDYYLPRINGVELCKAIRQKEHFHEKPIIFLTSNEKTDETIHALRAGAVDYLIKPINLEELSIRIRTHLNLYFSRKKIKNFAQNMEDLANERAKQLIHADRLATLGTLSASLTHEIKNPATFISGNIQTFEKFWNVLRELTQRHKESADNKEQLDFILKEMPGLISGMQDGIVRIRKVIDSLKSFSRKESGPRVEFNLPDSIDNALMLCQKRLKDNVAIEKELPEKNILVKGDPQQIEQVFVNLITNAADAMEGQKEATLKIQFFSNSDHAIVKMEDSGPVVAPELLDKIWEPFFTTKPKGKGTGLGIPISRTIIENHGGQIEVERKKEGGLIFTINFPFNQRSDL
jgi:C4-dicarboxylate-specific signal transduction histidine kinase